MNIEEFFNKYGTDTTTNFQLIQYAKELKIPNFHYVMRDEMNLLSKDKLPLNVITNIHTSKENGVHHNCFYIGSKGNYFFDSYGLNPTKEVEKFIQNGIGSNFKIQQSNTKYCGQLSLYVLYCLNKTDDSFEDIVLDIKKYLL